MNPIWIVAIVAGVAYVLGRRLVGEMVEIKGLLVLPIVLTVLGATQVRGLGEVSAASLAFVVVGCALSVGLGVLRGRTVHLGERGGHLWMRYRPASVGLWLLNLGLKGAMVPVERGVSPGAASAADRAILLSIGLGILAETAVVLVRAMRTDAVVVWEKGEHGQPHRVSPAFEQARSYVRGSTSLVGAAVSRFGADRGW